MRNNLKFRQKSCKLHLKELIFCKVACAEIKSVYSFINNSLHFKNPIYFYIFTLVCLPVNFKESTYNETIFNHKKIPSRLFHYEFRKTFQNTHWQFFWQLCFYWYVIQVNITITITVTNVNRGFREAIANFQKTEMVKIMSDTEVLFESGTGRERKTMSS